MAVVRIFFFGFSLCHGPDPGLQEGPGLDIVSAGPEVLLLPSSPALHMHAEGWT